MNIITAAHPTATANATKPVTTFAAMPTTPDFDAIKTKQQQTWAAGDYALVGSTLNLVGERLAETMNISACEQVLDVAAGNGNMTLAAARRFADVTSTDYVAALLEKGRARAEADGLTVKFRQADAEALPFASNVFDAVVSTFGVMFTPDQDKSAAEMMRVCKPGGRIGMANWTPDSFIGALFQTIAQYVQPPAGVNSPLLWGTEEHIADLMGDDAATIETTRQTFVFRYRSIQHWIHMFRTYYGPTHKAFAALSEADCAALANDMTTLAETSNRATDGTMSAPTTYLETVVTKRR